MKNGISIYLDGPFRVENAEGVDVTPGSAKAQGLILLLLASQGYQHTRIWLQDKLWSDRGTEQAAGSLRQVLMQIRRSFGEDQDILSATRQRISLDRNRIDCVHTGNGEFAEGLDVRDNEFEYWLAEQRAKQCETRGQDLIMLPAPAETPRKWRLALITADESGASGPAKALGMVFSSLITRSIRETYSSEISLDPSDEGADLRIKLETAYIEADKCVLRAVLTGSTGRDYLWANYATVNTSNSVGTWSEELMKLHGDLIQALSGVVALQRAKSHFETDAVFEEAIAQLFKMTPEGIQFADDALDAAFENEPNGLYLAWRAQICTIKRIERLTDDVDTLRELAGYYSTLALERDPNNSMVLATVANTRLFVDGDAHGALDLAKQSVEINPANPMAWWARSTAELYTGRAKQALQDATQARSLASRSPHRFWWDQQVFGASLFLRPLEENIALLESVAAQCKNFRPPLRYLLMLYAEMDRPDKAIEVAGRLKEIEPDFSVERMIKDLTYPASLIHREPLFEFSKALALE